MVVVVRYFLVEVLIQICPFPGVFPGFPPRSWFVGGNQVHRPDGISVGSASSAQLAVVTNRHTDRPRYMCCRSSHLMLYVVKM